MSSIRLEYGVQEKKNVEMKGRNEKNGPRSFKVLGHMKEKLTKEHTARRKKRTKAIIGIKCNLEVGVTGEKIKLE